MSCGKHSCRWIDAVPPSVRTLVPPFADGWFVLGFRDIPGLRLFVTL
jgi:hypothetical protein